MRIFLISILTLGCSFLVGQEILTVLPLELSVSPSYNTRIFTKKSTKKAKDERLAKKAKALNLEFQQYADEVIDYFEKAYSQNVIFLRSDDALPDSLRGRYSEFEGSISQAIYRNQRKKDDGLSVSIAQKGYSNKALRESNESNLRLTSKPFEAYFNTRLFLAIKVIGLQNSAMKGNGIYGGIRIQVIVTDAQSGETILFKTFSRGTMKTKVWTGNSNNNAPPSAVGVRKGGFQAKLESMLKTSIEKANKLADKG